MVKAFRLGKPYSTGAVSENPVKFEAKFEMEGWQITKKSDSVILTKNLQEQDIVLGLGEQLGGINKRGRKYITYNHDTHEHTPDQLALYGSHPFIMIKGKKDQGLFIDFPGEIEFDVGFRDIDQLKITIKTSDFDLYYWIDTKWQLIVTEYLELTGGVYIPPRWAFGYQQSRWSYKTAVEVCETAEKFRQLGIPCDAIYLDIDYMDSYKVFTVDQEKFPQFHEFVSSMKDKGFHLVPIIDPGVKIEKGYDVYEEGIKNGCFCQDDSGNDFEVAVWPGLTLLPDFSQEKVRSWWGNLYDRLIQMGVEGFWNDMNEPAIFYSSTQAKAIQENLKQAVEEDKSKKINLSALHNEINNLHNSREDYQSIYQNPEKGQKIQHDKIHNLYGYQMAQAASEVFQQKYSDRRILLFSRSSYSGMQRYAGIWYGDNKSWWSHLELNIKMLINANLAGFFYSGADIGGFGSDCQAELILRWLQLGVFSPLFRNHSAIGTRRQELWQFDESTLAIARNIIRLRYALIPYLYGSFLEHAGMNVPLIKPLMWDFEDERSQQIEDQFMYGNSLMIAPVYKNNAKGRYVYLPQNRWLLWKARTWEERNLSVCTAGDSYFDCELDRQLIFIRENQLIALQEPEEFVGQRNPDTLFIIGLLTDKAKLKLMSDQGKFPAFAGMSVLDIKVERKNDSCLIDISTIRRENLYWKNLVFELYDAKGKMVVIHKKI